MPEISLVITTKNAASHLDRFLSLLFELDTRGQVDLIIIDQGSWDNTSDVVAKHVTHGFIRYIQSKNFDSFTQVKHIAHQKARFSSILFVDINENGLTWNDDLKDKAPGPRKSPEQIKDWLQTYLGQGVKFDQNWNNSPAPADLNVLFVNKGRMSTNSGYHIQYYANLASHQGASVVVAVPKRDDNEQLLHDSFRVQTYDEIRNNGTVFPDGRGPDVVHAWTPRERVRIFCSMLAGKYSFKTIIHLEDNEEYLTENSVGRPFKELSAVSLEELDQIIPQNRFHPIRGWQWLKQADGLTMIIDTLQRFNPKGLPSLILPAPVDERLFYPRPINCELRKKLNIPENHIILAYIGNVRQLKKQEASDLYQALVQLNELGIPATLLRTGENYVPLDVEEEKYKQFEISLGWVERTEVPDILAAADILIQPGRPGPFDDQRIPAKLPEYFAMGRPVVLPKSNLGLKVEHGVEGYVVDKADAEGIVGAIQSISSAHSIKGKLAMGAAHFFRTRLSNYKLMHSLELFYLTSTSKPTN